MTLRQSAWEAYYRDDLDTSSRLFMSSGVFLISIAHTVTDAIPAGRISVENVIPLLLKCLTAANVAFFRAPYSSYAQVRLSCATLSLSLSVFLFFHVCSFY